MELAIEPDTYCPNIDENGNYVDKVPSFNVFKHGLYCSCGARKDKLYETSASFSGHIKTKIHQKWLAQLNMNRINYYVENEKLQETIHNQKIIIARLEKDVNTKIMTIDFLTQLLHANMNVNVNANIQQNQNNDMNNTNANKNNISKNLLDLDI